MDIKKFLGSTLLGFALLLPIGLHAEDAPQWRGFKRDGHYMDVGLLKAWPASGPKLAWKTTNIGLGHATPSVNKGVIYGMGLRGEDEYIWALDAKTGKEKWATPIAKRTQLRAAQGGHGPRSTPTFDNGKLYALGVAGDAVCVDSKDGKIIWTHNLASKYQAEVPVWGYSESPLVDGKKVLFTPGGKTATIVAFDKVKGDVVWETTTSPTDAAHYSSAIPATIESVKQYIQFVSGGVVGVHAETGKTLWRYNAPANRVANCSTPLFLAPNLVFAATAYNTGGGLAKITKDGENFKAEEVYFTKEMMNHHGGMVLVGEHLYGFTVANLMCIEFKTGNVVWSDRSVGKGSVIYADGHLIARSERGPIALIEANPKAYTEKGRFDQPDRSRDPAWPYPVIADGHLLIRDQDVLLCYDIREAK